jgi:hypothetical protein
MNTARFQILGCVAWAGVAITSAAEARALAYTTQVGDYALCATYNSLVSPPDPCLEFVYFNQHIKFVSTPCAAGGCGDGSATTYTDITYSVGRKAAGLQETCGSWRVYGLGPCAC